MSTIDFDAPVAEFARKSGIELETVVRRIASDLLGKIIDRTPVDTGRAKNGWDLTIEAPSEFLPPETTSPSPNLNPAALALIDETTSPSPNLNPAALALIDGTQQVFIINNLPYIERLENGHSDQAPPGSMLKLSMAEVEAEITLMTDKL